MNIDCYNCPSCKSENTRKLSLIHRDGTSTTSGLAFINNRIGSFSSRNQTDNGRLAAPPEEPVMMLVKRVGCAILIFFIPFGIIYVLYFIVTFPPKYMKHVSTYPTAKKDWENGYMCLRCDSIFTVQ